MAWNGWLSLSSERGGGHGWPGMGGCRCPVREVMDMDGLEWVVVVVQ